MQVDAYAARRDEAHARFREWGERLRSGLLHSLTETQVEADFSGQLLVALGYTTAAGVPPGRPWSMTPKWAVPGGGIVDLALGEFHPDEAGRAVGRPIIMVELKGAGTDLDRCSRRGTT
jgi:hypothetical protein